MMGFFRFVALVALLWCANCVESRIRHYTFDVVTINTTKLCSSKPIITVNGKFPGPTLRAREDDTVIVNVINRVKDNNNVTIHWHGVRQLRTGWSDGPAYITQCPIQPGQSYIYNFTLTGQRGTLLWHAHINWQRATVHGAIVVLPKNGIPYPYPKPYSEEIVVLGEWWKSEIEEVIDRAVKSGLPPVVSDSHTINGDPGPFPNCSSSVGYTLKVETGKTYLLRIVNAALNDNLFFKVANHRLVIVEVDGAYTKPFETDSIFIAPGQTTNALLTADRKKVGGAYEITISPFVDGKVPVDERVATGSLRYEGVFVFSSEKRNTAGFTTTDELRSLDSEEYPTNVPRSVDRSLLFAIGVGMNPCSTCVNKTRFVASINNVTFVMPTLALLQAHYYKITGVYTDDFPATPPVPYDYTGNPPENVGTLNGTRVFRVLYNSTVQIVLQGTSMVAAESHPMHLHGFNFYVVGKGVGNYDPDEDPKRFNLVDPVERNTVSVPTAGWTAIRFRADNPGVWFFHCHLEVHTTWGLKMAFLVENGNGPNESILSPPNDLPKC